MLDPHPTEIRQYLGYIEGWIQHEHDSAFLRQVFAGSQTTSTGFGIGSGQTNFQYPDVLTNQQAAPYPFLLP